jgi:hypothetical protein
VPCYDRRYTAARVTGTDERKNLTWKGGDFKTSRMMSIGSGGDIQAPDNRNIATWRRRCVWRSSGGQGAQPHCSGFRGGGPAAMPRFQRM